MATKLFAKLRAFTAKLWEGEPGIRFRSALKTTNQKAEEYGLGAENLVDHASSALKGASHEKLAKAESDYAEAESKKAETFLRMKGAEAELKRKDAEANKAVEEARRAKAEASSAELVYIDQRIELEKKLKALGVSVYKTDEGDLVLKPLPLDPPEAP